jgi:preprotein translocase subunit SecE
MTNSNISKYKKTDVLIWLGITLVTLAVFYVQYFLHLTNYLMVICWVLWLTFSSALVFISSQGKQLLEFGKESKVELEKVVWPTRQETIQTTTIVMVMVTVTGFVLWGIDSGMMWSIGKITHLG